MNRYKLQKDTFVSILPGYGLTPDDLSSEKMRSFIYNDYHPIESRKTADLDRTFFAKMDEHKRYTEELL
eukprot:CAMPEP_0170552642 /NCGR_PEP_ID=MMETSP0211-20121228/10520_1 /TAXON_ID=311385 /ORGANISM="Pseudokeronopsis sp., Strain OXSARD2" /LENGTH=68 /DNA_ID=CAMNT_0010860495 /DNA_START=772 /DNA_END=975 /DNA_ORIENTATION=-